MDEELIKKLEKQLHLNVMYAGMKANAVSSVLLNTKINKEEGELIGALIALAETAAHLLQAKGYK